MKKNSPLLNEVIRHLTEYFYHNNIDRKPFGITNISVKKKWFRKAVVITIELERVGLFLGRKGSQFDKIKKHLSTVLEMDVTLLLIESFLWECEYREWSNDYEEKSCLE